MIKIILSTVCAIAGLVLVLPVFTSTGLNPSSFENIAIGILLLLISLGLSK